MPAWELIDHVEPNRDRIPVRCELRLRSELRRLAALEPRVAELVSAEADGLVLALCGPWAMAYWPQGPYVLRNRVVRNLDRDADDPAGLLYRGHQLLLASDALFLIDDAIELAAFVYNYSQLPIWVGPCADAKLHETFPPRPATVPSRQVLEGICVLHRPAAYAG